MNPQPPSSPANLLILTVIGVLGITAVAAAFMGGGHDDVTPHGQVLGDLHAVAEAQQRHHAEHGSFAEWLRSLEVQSSQDVRMSMVRATEDEWQAVAHHTIGLTCTQSGTVVNGVAQTDRPACFTSQ